MNNIEACLAMLKNLPAERYKLRRLQVLLACYGRWVASRDVKPEAGIHTLVENGVRTLHKAGLLDAKYGLKKGEGKKNSYTFFYRTSHKGIEEIMKLFKK